MDWSEYWNSNNNINHKILGKWSEYYCKALTKLNKLNDDDIVLDYGAGTGVISGYISNQVKSVVAYDNSTAMHRLCVSNMNKFENVSCSIELSNTQNVSFILINSVLQYIDSSELDELLNFVSKNTNATSMIISDVVPDDYNPYFDAINNLWYSLNNQFLFNYLFFLFKEFMMRILPGKSFVWNKYNKTLLIAKLKKYGWEIELIDNLSPSINRFSLFCYKEL